MGQSRHIAVAIPMMAELDNLPKILETLRNQTYRNFNLYVCLNQPEGWIESPIGREQDAYKQNQTCLSILKGIRDIEIGIVDRSSEGLGWTNKRGGVGWARKELFSKIIEEGGEDCIIVSMDADTRFSNKYLEHIAEYFNNNPKVSALSVPYRHPLSGDETMDRAMLRYEIYMRHYLISLLKIKNPYAFSALGSAMAFPGWAYQRVGGITPLQGGEDFYLMQKLCKTGEIGRQFPEYVEPQGRASWRVPFGTGPAVAKGVESMDASYPFYPEEGFKAIAETFTMFPALYDEDIETPMSAFLRSQLKTDDLWGKLRKNFKTKELFVHACEERADGLRILQFLRAYYPTTPANSCKNFMDFCLSNGIALPKNFSFLSTEIEELDSIRDQFFEIEMQLR